MLRIASSAGPARCTDRPLPPVCEEADRRSAAVFDVFWQTYAENYPFFAAKDIDWARSATATGPA